MNMRRDLERGIVFVDLEVGVDDRRIRDIGAVRGDGATLHSSDLSSVRQFLENAVRSGSIAVSDFQGAFRKIVTPYISIQADRHSSGPAVNDVPY